MPSFVDSSRRGSRNPTQMNPEQPPRSVAIPILALSAARIGHRIPPGRPDLRTGV